MDKEIHIRLLSGLMDFHWDKVKRTPESDAEGPVTVSKNLDQWILLSQEVGHDLTL